MSKIISSFLAAAETQTIHLGTRYRIAFELDASGRAISLGRVRIFRDGEELGLGVSLVYASGVFTIGNYADACSLIVREQDGKLTVDFESSNWEELSESLTEASFSQNLSNLSTAVDEFLWRLILCAVILQSADLSSDSEAVNEMLDGTVELSTSLPIRKAMSHPHT